MPPNPDLAALVANPTPGNSLLYPTGACYQSVSTHLHDVATVAAFAVTLHGRSLGKRHKRLCDKLPAAEQMECFPVPSDSLWLPADAYQPIYTWEGERRRMQGLH